MTTTGADNPGPHNAEQFAPEPGRSPAAVAAELVAHGLLEFTLLKDTNARGSRVERVLGAINPLRMPPAAATASRPQAPIGDGRETLPTPAFAFRRIVRWSLAAAALIAVCVGLVIFGVPGERAALAELKLSITAMRNAGQRRYEIRMLRWGQDSPDQRPDAIVDSSGEQILIRHTPPWARGGYAFAGRDDKGAWAIRNGKINRNKPERDFPPYITDGGESFMLEGMDHQLEQLPDRFTLERLDPAPVSGAADNLNFERIVAHRKSAEGPMPNHVDLWIDPATHLVERVEYRWDKSAGFDKGPRGGPPDGDRRGPRSRDHDGPGGPGHGDRPPGPPPGDDEPSPNDHGPPPGGRPGPGARPRLILFQRVDAPALAPDWYHPEAHLQ